MPKTVPNPDILVCPKIPVTRSHSSLSEFIVFVRIIEAEELASPYQTEIKYPTCAYDWTHLELTSQPLERFVALHGIVPNCIKFIFRYQELSRDLVTKNLYFDRRWLQIVQVGNSFFSDPDVCQFVRQGKHLSPLEISTIDEYERSVFVGKDKTTKLLRIEFTVAVVIHHSVEHNQDAKSFNALPQNHKRIGPGASLARPARLKSKPTSHGLCDLLGVGMKIEATYKSFGIRSFFYQVVAKPTLPLLHSVDCIEQIWAWLTHWSIVDRSKVGHRQAFFRRFRQEEITIWRMGDMS